MTESRALGWLAVAAVAVIVWLSWPFAISLLLGALLAFTTAPMHDRFVARTGRPTLGAIMAVIATGLITLSVAAGFSSLFITRMVVLANAVPGALQEGGTITRLADTINRWLGGYGSGMTALVSRLQAGAGEIASASAAIAAAIAAQTFSALLGLFFALLTMYAVLRYWPQMVPAIVLMSPLNASHTTAVLDEFQRAGRTTLAGTVVTGIAQGIFAGLGFWLAGAPQPLFFGVATALASLIPAVGTMAVWLPIGIYLFATGHAGRALFEILWSLSTVFALCDYVIRPRLVGDEGMPPLLVFIALFGGLEVFGLSGLIAGPILMALAVSVLRLYAREQRAG